MEWEKSSGDLVALFDGIAPQGAGVEKKKMFGWPCCFVNGNLFCGLHKQSILFRLSEKDLAAFLKLKGASEFEPMPGRKMKGYGILGTPLERDRKDLTKWVARALEHAGSLPAKSKKPARRAAKKA